ncbi:MAG: NTP transferase domain-containing protein, partial [Caulobacterales bacterium]|nr:NTP transferase domain-containing protein [Caulobacterales bacterium]
MITPVLLCGGAGTRLWPLSRVDRPKQLLPLATDRSMLAETIARFDPAREDGFAPPMIVTGARYEAAARAECGGTDGVRYVIEPMARNTAPCIALAAHAIAERGEPDSVQVVLPADHLIRPVEAFRESLRAATAEAAAGDVLILF